MRADGLVGALRVQDVFHAHEADVLDRRVRVAAQNLQVGAAQREGDAQRPCLPPATTSSRPDHLVSCLLPAPSVVDIYLYDPGLAIPRVQVWTGVPYAAGSYVASGGPTPPPTSLQLMVVPASMPPFLSTIPAGPVFTATCSASSSNTPAAADTSLSGSDMDTTAFTSTVSGVWMQAQHGEDRCSTNVFDAEPDALYFSATMPSANTSCFSPATPSANYDSNGSYNSTYGQDMYDAYGGYQGQGGYEAEVQAQIASPRQTAGPALQRIACLLGVSAEDLEAMLANRTSYVRKELYTVLLDEHHGI
ncbi:hypothetical protein C8R44DRAFT_889776 [Mycena epipterygia]|nr:hypothetical protein C8R44DRAFT_889776 [Mycena epipterygia]